MATLKLSQIAPAPSNPVASDFIVGTTSGNTTDSLISFTQGTQALSLFSSSLQGVVPGSGGGTTNFLRADGTWASPSAGSTTIAINSTPITGGTSGRLLYDNSATVGELTLGSGISISGGALTFGIVVNTTAITGGTTGHVAYDNAGTFGEAANFTIVSGNPNVSSTHSYEYNSVNALYAATATNDWFVGSGGPGPGGLGSSNGDNIGIGNLAMHSLTTAQDNVAIGAQALFSMTSGSRNVAIGFNALNALTTQTTNFALGFGALTNCISSDNVAIGASSCQQLTTGTGNVGIGNNTCGASSAVAMTGGGNIAIGDNALRFVTTSVNNVAIGASACGSLTSSAGSLVAIGLNAFKAATTASDSVAIGVASLLVEQTGGQNCGVGSGTLQAQNGATKNTAIGNDSGIAVTTGSSNTLIGQGCAGSLTTGSFNVVLGNHTGSAAMANSIILSDGAGNLELDWNFTNASKWTLQTALNLAYVSNSGILVTDSSGNVTENNNSAAATVAGNFSADHRLQVVIGGTTFYIAMSTVAW